jgi:hypothetical protein
MKPSALLLLLLLASCSLFQGKEGNTAKESETKPRLVGRIASVPEGAGFVLIEAYGPWKVPDGGLLSGIGTEGRAANLIATGERLGQFSAADIRSGVAKVGDSVYYRPIKEETGAEGSVDSPVLSRPAPELETKTTSGESPPIS